MKTRRNEGARPGVERDVAPECPGEQMTPKQEANVRDVYPKAISGLLSAIALAAAGTWAADAPFSIKAGLYNQADSVDLGLSPASGTETFTVYAATASTDKYVNGVALIGFKGHLYCQWQSSALHEDSSDTWVAYSRSLDGKTWAAPMKLALPGTGDIKTSGGWWVNGDTLVAYVNVWPTALSPRGGSAWYATSVDGLKWSSLKALVMADGNPMAGVFEQDPHALPDGRIVNAAHFQPGLLAAPIFTDDPSGIRGWKRATYTNLSTPNNVSREIEPSWFRRSDGAMVMVFRDQTTTYRKLAATSTDRGSTWSTAASVEMPDSRAKQSAGNLPEGTAFQVGNPVDGKRRSPLVVTVARDGSIFDKAWVLRKGGSDLQAQRYTGKAKTLGYSYPKSTIWNGFLWVGYATNKEDVQCTRVPVVAIAQSPVSVPGTVRPTPGLLQFHGRLKVERSGVFDAVLANLDGRVVESVRARGQTELGGDLRLGVYLLRVRSGVGIETKVVTKIR